MLFFDLAAVVHLAHEHLAGFNLCDFGVGDPLDVVVAEFALQHRLGVTHAAQAHVADIGFGADVGHRHLVAQLAALQVLVEDEREFVGRAKARSARHGADDGRSRLLQEFLVMLPSFFGMVDSADRMRVARRAGAGHFVKRQLGAGGDDQVVIVQAAAVVQLQRIVRGVNPLDQLRDEADALFFQVRPDWKGDGFALAPAHRHPRVGRHELEIIHRVDDGDAVLRAEALAQLVGGRHAARACAEDDDVGHGLSPMGV